MSSSPFSCEEPISYHHCFRSNPDSESLFKFQIGRLWIIMDNGVLKDLGSESTSNGVPSALPVETLKPNELSIRQTQADEMASVGGSELIVLGSGSSTGVPSPLCLINPTDPPCHVCHKAMEGPHELNRNYRYRCRTCLVSLKFGTVRASTPAEN